MATWIAHMRVAEHFMNMDPSFNNKEFLVGNIGPDCGVPNEDRTSFTPDKKITHWLTDGENIDAENFRSIYLHRDDERYFFYLGYYFHLLTDIEWLKLYEGKKRTPLYADGLNSDKNFGWIIKKDWYGQDHLFLQNNPNSIFFSMFSKITDFENKYFDFYPQDAFSRQIRHITDFYLHANEDANREFPFLSKAEMDAFVSSTCATITMKK